MTYISFQIYYKAEFFDLATLLETMILLLGLVKEENIGISKNFAGRLFSWKQFFSDGFSFSKSNCWQLHYRRDVFALGLTFT